MDNIWYFYTDDRKLAFPINKHNSIILIVIKILISTNYQQIFKLIFQQLKFNSSFFLLFVKLS